MTCRNGFSRVKPQIAAAWEQAAPRGHSIDPELEGVRLEQRWIKTRIGLEVDERDPAVDLADAVDQPAHAGAPDRHVEAGFDGERAGPREGAVEITDQHLAAWLRPAVEGEQVAARVVPPP